MPGWKTIATKPIRMVVGPVERLVKRKLAGLIDACLEPVREDLRIANAKMDRILDLNLAPDVLRDFRIHNETLRAIQADSDLIREQNPLFQSMLRDLSRIELRLEELSARSEGRGTNRGAA